MADDFSLDGLKEAVVDINDLKAAATDTSAIVYFKDSINDVSQSVKDLSKTLPMQSNLVKNLTSKFSDFTHLNSSKFFTDMKTNFAEMNESGELSSRQLLKLSGGIAAVYASSTNKLEISGELEKISKEASESSGQLSDVYDKIMKLIPGGKKLKEVLKSQGVDPGNTFKQADHARNLETAFLRQATAAGDFETVIKSLRGNFDGLGGKVIGYTNQMANVANANNISFDSAVRLSNMLRKIPDALDMTVRVGGESGKTMNIMNAALKVASGTGQDFKDVIGDINLVLLNFNSTGTDALEFVSKLHTAASAIKMPMDLMRSFVGDAAKQFRFLGDNTESAINIMSRFGPALKSSGVGPEGIKDIVGNLIRVTSQLDVAQRGFVSGQTGGPGGLQGGYKMALAMKEGKMDDVFSDVEKTLKKMMGGRLVGLEDAATSSVDANQMAKQVQMLTTGPLAIASSEGEAFKIIEAFTKGMPSMEDVSAGMGSKEDILAESVKTGNDIQKHQLNATNAIRNEIEKQSVLEAFSLDALLKMSSGKDSNIGQMALKKMSESQNVSNSTKVISGEPTDLVSEIDKTLSSAKDLANDALSLMPLVGDTVKKLIKSDYQGDVAKNTAKDINAGASSVENHKNQEKKAVDGRSTGEPSTIIIKVMSDKDVERIIEVKLDEYGKITSHKEAAASYGQSGR